MSFYPAVAAPADIRGDKLWLVFQGARVLLCRDLALGYFPSLKDVSWLGMQTVAQQYLGRWNEQPVFAVSVPDTEQPPADYQFEDLRRLLGQVDDELFALAGRASQVLEWEKTHRFCGRCGAATIAHAQGERARICPVCAFTSYPRINPCVIVAVTRGEEILLARAQRFSIPMFSTLAGFIEAGETAEETVLREVQEEVGVKARNLRYFGSQSWPFPGNLMLGFHADYESGSLVLQEEEIAEAHFFHFSELPLIPPSGSIAYALINDFVARCRAAGT
jgi:NAD+ diphosphatase